MNLEAEVEQQLKNGFELHCLKNGLDPHDPKLWGVYRAGCSNTVDYIKMKMQPLLGGRISMGGSSRPSRNLFNLFGLFD